MANIIDIPSSRGNFSYDPETERIFRDGELVPSTEAQPIYAYYGKRHFPQFAGIWLKEIDGILTRSGRINQRTGDVNLIQ